jgi:hypothetical protein
VLLTIFASIITFLFFIIHLAFNTFTTLVIMSIGLYVGANKVVKCLVFPGSSWLFRRKIEM